jgi:hypothetical protein
MIIVLLVKYDKESLLHLKFFPGLGVVSYGGAKDISPFKYNAYY